MHYTLLPLLTIGGAVFAAAFALWKGDTPARVAGVVSAFNAIALPAARMAMQAQVGEVLREETLHELDEGGERFTTLLVERKRSGDRERARHGDRFGAPKLARRKGTAIATPPALHAEFPRNPL